MSEFGNCIFQLLATTIFIAVVQVGVCGGGGAGQGRARGLAWGAEGARARGWARATRFTTRTLRPRCRRRRHSPPQPWILVGIGPLAVVYYFLQKYYR